MPDAEGTKKLGARVGTTRVVQAAKYRKRASLELGFAVKLTRNALAADLCSSANSHRGRQRKSILTPI